MSKKNFKETTWGSVTLETIKNTEIWKKYCNNEGNPTIKRHNLINAVLYTLGYDIESDFKYKEQRFVTVRSHEDKTKGIETSVFTFPVKKGHKLEHTFKSSSLINYDVGQETVKIDLSTFGLDYFKTSSNKHHKKRTRQQFLDDILSNSEHYDF